MAHRIKFSHLDVIVMQIGSPGIPPNVLISWAVEPIRSSAHDIEFHLERSQDPSFDDPEEISSTIIGVDGQSVYEYLDITVNLQNYWRRYYYRIRAVDTADSKEAVSLTKTWESSPKIFELEIIARHDWLLRYETGTPCFALVERTVGSPHCPSCYNPSLGRSSKSQCDECYGTGRQRPFFQPVLTFIDFNPPAKATQMQQQETQVGQTNVWWSAYPQLKPRDIFVEVLSGERWRIVSVNPVGDVRTTIQHFATLERIRQRDVEHGIKIPEATQRQAVADLEAMKCERRF